MTTPTRIAFGRSLLLALLLSFMLPTTAHLVAMATGGAAWVEVCTGAGMRWVAQSEAPLDGDADEFGAAPACKWCSHAAAITAPPPADVSRWQLAPRGPVPVVARATPARSPLPWARAAPRGPPPIS